MSSMQKLYETNKNFKDYCDHWVNNPGAEYMNRGITLSLDQIFEFEVVKLYADSLVNCSDFSGINGIVKMDDLVDDKSC